MMNQHSGSLNIPKLAKQVGIYAKITLGYNSIFGQPYLVLSSRDHRGNCIGAGRGAVKSSLNRPPALNQISANFYNLPAEAIDSI